MGVFVVIEFILGFVSVKFEYRFVLVVNVIMGIIKVKICFIVKNF